MGGWVQLMGTAHSGSVCCRYYRFRRPGGRSANPGEGCVFALRVNYAPQV